MSRDGGGKRDKTDPKFGVSEVLNPVCTIHPMCLVTEAYELILRIKFLNMSKKMYRIMKKIDHTKIKLLKFVF